MARLLIVDDEPAVRNFLSRILESAGHICLVAGGARQALDILAQAEVDLVLCDVNMPDGSGLALIGEIRDLRSDAAVIMVTGEDDPRFAQAALDAGAWGWVIKPVSENGIRIQVAGALRRRELELDNRSYRNRLEEKVAERTAALRASVAQIERTTGRLRRAQEETARRLASAAEFRDADTGRHIERVSLYCDLIARRAGLDAEACERVRLASPLHDIGKIGVPDAILLKPGRLSPEEFDIMKRHAETGRRILDGSPSEILALAAEIAWTHHERMDGSGYPRGLAHDAIPVPGRIAAIADVFDALTSVRPYKPAWPVDEALLHLRDRRGRLFDRTLVDLFSDSREEIDVIRVANPDRRPALSREFHKFVPGSHQGG